jgi:SAM-dependent methyltransferase
MGNANQLIYLKHWLPRADGPILEVGSKDYGSTASFRDFYASSEYVGLDMEEGKGVDVVVDLTRSIGPLRENHFGLAICCSVLEHVEKPWLFAQNLTRVVRPGGQLYMSVPWVWRYHAYPDDYFRFSHRGVKSLFDEFTWKALVFTTNIQGEFYDIREGEPLVDDLLAVRVKAAGEQERKYLPYLMVNMLGTRNGPAS